MYVNVSFSVINKINVCVYMLVANGHLGSVVAMIGKLLSQWCVTLQTLNTNTYILARYNKSL